MMMTMMMKMVLEEFRCLTRPVSYVFFSVGGIVYILVPYIGFAAVGYGACIEACSVRSQEGLVLKWFAPL
jgi:hypothetical protein